MNNNAYWFQSGDSPSVYQSRYYLPVTGFGPRSNSPESFSSYTQKVAAAKYLSPPITPPAHNCGSALELATAMDPNRGYFNHPPQHPEEAYRLPAMQYPSTQPINALPSPAPRLDTTLPPQMEYLPSVYMNTAITESNVSPTYYVTEPVPIQVQCAPTSISPFNHGGYYYPISHGFSAGTHKREIKRRTKSGCLTCRQRRIKCDEKKPECSHCIKSRRTCLWQSLDSKNASRRGTKQSQQQPTTTSTRSKSHSPTTATSEAGDSYPQPISNVGLISTDTHASTTFNFGHAAAGPFQRGLPVTLPNISTIIPADQFGRDYRYPYSSTT